MNAKNFSIAMGEVSDKYVIEAANYQRKRKKTGWVKWGAVAACLCLVIVGAINGINNQLRQYVIENNINVISSKNSMDSSTDVSPKQATKISAANEIHNLISAKRLDWYGACYYDFDRNMVILGLTVNSVDNQDTILKLIGDADVQFVDCSYSYQYLEELYSKLETERPLLRLLGVERFNISVEKNRLNVHLSKAEDYDAIYAVNRLDDLGGAIIFVTDNITTDMRS